MNLRDHLKVGSVIWVQTYYTPVLRTWSAGVTVNLPNLPWVDSVGNATLEQAENEVCVKIERVLSAGRGKISAPEPEPKVTMEDLF